MSRHDNTLNKLLRTRLVDLVGRLRDDAGLMKERSVGCRKIGDVDGQSVASQIADDLDEAAHLLSQFAECCTAS